MHAANAPTMSKATKGFEAEYLKGMCTVNGGRKVILVTPNVRAKRATTVARQARAVENATAPRTGPGGLPLSLRLSEGLGRTGEAPLQLLNFMTWTLAAPKRAGKS